MCSSDLEGSILKELKMDGVVNEDSEVIIHMDNSFEEAISSKEGSKLKSGVTSNIIPVITNKDGSIRKSSKVVSTEKLEDIEDYVTVVVKDFGEDILSGNTKVEPYKLKKLTGCDYCPYDGVCGFDLRIPGFKHRKLSDLDNDNIWDKIHEIVKAQANNGEIENDSNEDKGNANIEDNAGSQDKEKSSNEDGKKKGGEN